MEYLELLISTQQKETAPESTTLNRSKASRLTTPLSKSRNCHFKEFYWLQYASITSVTFCDTKCLPVWLGLGKCMMTFMQNNLHISCDYGLCSWALR